MEDFLGKIRLNLMEFDLDNKKKTLRKVQV